MKLPSFRLRVTLFSVGLAGVALVGLGAVAWGQIYHATLNRLDAQIFNLLMYVKGPRKLEPAELHQESRWQRYDDLLPNLLGANTEVAIALLVLDSEGNKIHRSTEVVEDRNLDNLLANQLRLMNPPPGKLPSQNFAPPPPPAFFQTKSTSTKTWRIGTIKLATIQIAMAVDRQIVRQEMATISNIFLISIPGVLVLIAIGAWLLSNSALRPVDRLSRVIQEVSATDLDRKIPRDKVDREFAELIQVFNQMLERLERSFKQASRFSGDAAHELKTPLTILQGELERTLQQVPPGSEIQQRLSNLLDEVSHLSSIVRKLLLFSLADAGQMSLYLVEVDLSELLCQMLEDVEMQAPHLTLRTNIPHKLKIKGDRDLLMQVLQNLLSNAIKYNLTDGWITIGVKQSEKKLHIVITNASKEIPTGDRDRLFDRFYRGDPARTRKVEGIGLGLSLAREIVRAHHGELTLAPATSGETSFSIILSIGKDNSESSSV